MTRPRILVTNDDGIHAQGIQTLVQALSPLAEVWVVAPASEQSAVSNAISLRHPLRLRGANEARQYSVSGTPTDCVYLAMNHLLRESPPDLLVSGINHGANLADDVFYSGTVAGAIEATLNDLPSIAFSMAGRGPYPFDQLTGHIQRLAEYVLRARLPRGVLINVNFPPDTLPDTKHKITKLGRRTYGRIVVEKTDPRQTPYYWLGGSELGFDDLPGTDCNAIADGFISVTPIHLDLTHYRFLEELKTDAFFTNNETS